MTEDRCVCCGKIIPEGRMVCRDCENGNVSVQQTNKSKWYLRLLKKLGVNIKYE